MYPPPPVFEVPLTRLELLITAMSSSILLLSMLSFLYIYIRTRIELHFATFLIALFGFIFTSSELMILIYGGINLNGDAAVQFHRIEQLSAAGFIFVLPLLLNNILSLSKRWIKVNSMISVGASIFFVLLVIAAYVSPNLFISLTDPQQGYYIGEQATYGRGTEGILYNIRDIFLILSIIYAVFLFIKSGINRGNYKRLSGPFIGLLIMSYSGLSDMLEVILDYNIDPFFAFRFSRFSAGLTIFIVTIIVTAIGEYISMSSEIIRAKHIAEDQLENFLLVLASAIESKDSYTGGHVERVANYSRDLALELDMSEQKVRDIYLGAIVHDVGKIGIKESVLMKPDKLNNEEINHIREHPRIGRDILMKINYAKTAADVAHYHQEKWDGSGYPTGRKGTEIPLAARIVSIADTWDAITTDRPYRAAMSLQAALSLMKVEAGRSFDPGLLKVFLDDKKSLYKRYLPEKYDAYK